MKNKLILIILLSLVISACTTKSNMAHFTAISTKVVNSNPVDLTKLKKTEVVGTDSSKSFLGFANNNPRLNKAVTDALVKGNGDLILNPIIKIVYTNYPFVTIKTIEVRGTVVNTKENLNK